MMQKIGAFLLQKEAHAVSVAFFAVLLEAFGFPVGFVGIIVLALVTLQKGAKSGFWVLAWMALPALALLYLKRTGLIDVLFARAVIVWALAVVLRRYHSWRATLQVLAGLGVVSIVLLHVFKPNLQAWWTGHLTEYLKQVMRDADWKFAKSPVAFAAHLAPIATGVTAFFFSCGALMQLMFARWWQYALVKPGGFGDEFRQIRLTYPIALIVVVLLILAILKFPIAMDVMPMALLPFFIAGLSLLHFFAKEKKSLMYLLVFIYIGLFFLPAVAISLLSLLAFFDIWFHFNRGVR